MDVVSLQDILGINHWLVIVALALIAAGMFTWIRSFEKRYHSSNRPPLKWIVMHRRGR